MGLDGLRVGVEIRKFAIISIRIFYRSVCNHPFFVSILLLLLFLYRSFPFLFSLLVSFSPVLVCTAVLLGTLLSLGEPNFPLIEQDEKTLAEISKSNTDSVENNTICFERDENIDRVNEYTELGREIVEEPLVDEIDTVGQFDVNSREIEFVKQQTDEVNSEFENMEIERKSSLDDPKIQVGVDVGLSLNHDEVHENGFCGKSAAENVDNYRSAEGSVDSQMRGQFGLDDVLENSLPPVDAQKPDQFDVVEDSLSPARKVQAAVLAQLRNQLESTIGSWNHFDVVVPNRSSAAQKAQAENSDEYKSAEGSVDDTQLESSFKAWNQLGFDRDDNDNGDDDEYEDGSDSGSDGAESSSPDASMADIIPMLDELHPLLDDENPQTSDLSHHSSIHSGYESDEKDGDIQSDDDPEEEEEETQGIKEEDGEHLPILWTADDQKNLMDLGTSDLERNQRLESLIARRRARRMMVERNLIDLDSMDLQFQVAPISTTRRNPFDLPRDSYDDLGLPPIPGSAPSVMMPRHNNPFDLPYDSSEEKPDLMGDSFQKEFMELYYQGEASNPRDAVFQRNETFSMGSSSSIFSFGARPSRFRPYFVPERTDSDAVSYSFPLQRQSSELSESKASSAPEIESPYAGRNGEETMRDEHELGEEMEPSSEIDQDSLLVEPGSQSFSDDLHSLLDQETDFVSQVPEIELGKAGNSPSSSSSTPKEFNDFRVEAVNENGIDTQVKHLIEESVSGIPRKHSVEALDFNNGIEFGDDHPIEPIYDSSPHSVTKNPSSIPSDLHIQRSEIHLSQLSIVGRDLVMTEEPKIHEDAEQCITDEIQGVEVNDQILSSEVSVNSESSAVHEYEPKVHEDAEQCVTDEIQGVRVNYQFLLSEVSVNSESSEVHEYKPKVHEDSEQCVPDETQGVHVNDQFMLSEVSVNSESIVAHKYELHSSVDSSEIQMLEDKSSDNKDSHNEESLILNREHDGTGVYILDTIDSENDKGSAFHENYFQGPILTSEDRDTSILEYSVSHVQSELMSLTSEIKEETTIGNEGQQIMGSSSNLVNRDNDMVDRLVSALGESLDSPHDSAVNYPKDNSDEQESSIIDREVEEVSQVSSLDESLNIFAVEEPKESISIDAFQKDQPSFKPEEFEDEEQVDENISQEVGVSLSDEKIINYFTNDINEMDERLLSELDVVGDFSASMSNPNTENQSFEETLVRANFDPQQHFKTVTEIAEPNFTGFEESILNSHGGEDSRMSLPVVDTQSAEIRSVSEEGVQTSDIVESVEAELIRELPETSLETEFLQKDTEGRVGIHDEQVDENFEDIAESEAKNFDNDEAVEQALEAETEVGSVELPPLQVNRDFIEMPEFSVVEASAVSSMEEIRALVESEQVEKDSEIKGIQETVESQECLPVEECIIIPSFDSDEQIESVGSTKSEPLLIDRDSTAKATDSEDDQQKAEPSESEPLPIDSDANRIQQKSSLFEEKQGFGSVELELPTSDTLFKSEDEIKTAASTESYVNFEEQTDLPLDSETIQPRLEFDDQLEIAAPLVSNSLPIHSDVEEKTESHSVKSEIAHSIIESEDQTEKIESMEATSDGSHRQTEVEASHSHGDGESQHLEFSSSDDSGED